MNKELNSKQSLLRKLKMKYFWEQKFLEVSKFIGIIILIIGGGGFVPYYLGKFFYHFFPSLTKWLHETEVMIAIDYWYTGFLSLLVILGIICILLLTYWRIEEWIESNLVKAEKRARSELKMKMKGGSQ